MSDSVSITVEFVHETEAAILVSIGQDEYWLPKSKITLPEDYSDEVFFEVEVPQWLAEDKGLV